MRQIYSCIRTENTANDDASNLEHIEQQNLQGILGDDGDDLRDDDTRNSRTS